MKNILFIAPGQFGTQTSTYYYCLLLKDKYRINYIGFDDGQQNKNIAGINYIHLPQGRNRLINRISLFKAINKEFKKNKYDLIFINYFIFCSFIKFFSKDKIVVEIRSGFIFPRHIKRILYNTVLFFEVRLFNHITTISTGIVNYLHLPKRTQILPLGGKSFPLYHKDFDTLRVLYVGTFHERNIYNTIYAFGKFFNEFKNVIQAKYTIIGFGSETETERIISTINKLKMNKHIFYKGVIRYPELSKYFIEHNIGMSYIPIKRHFQYQPPYKTFEYLLSGMVVIATATSENKKVINNSNGIIINDSIEDIYSGLKYIFMQRISYKTENIQREAQKHSWDNIVSKNLIPLIDSLVTQN